MQWSNTRAVGRPAKIHKIAITFVVPGVALLTLWMQTSSEIVENHRWGLALCLRSSPPRGGPIRSVFLAPPSSSRGGEGVGARERAPTVPSWSLAATPTANQRALLQWGSRGTRGNRTTPGTVQPHYVRYNIAPFRISLSCLPPGRSAPCT